MQWQWGRIVLMVFTCSKWCAVSLSPCYMQNQIKKGETKQQCRQWNQRRDTPVEMKERFQPASENSQMQNFYGHSIGLSTNKDLTIKPKKKSQTESSSEPFSIQPFYPLKKVFGQNKIIFFFLSLFPHCFQISYSQMWHFSPFQSKKITEKGMHLCSLPQGSR